ncbi:c-type cytochrome [Alienimonas sp. DA493]|uniref:c-type cytochrome n=1 Tax=Alienimonas sp. DA493 TaxID=3373605 RepID=UPI00375435AC
MRRRSPAAAPPAVRLSLGGCLAGFVLLGAVGCEPAPEPEFVPPPKYAGLLEELRTGTRAEVPDLETGELVERDLVGFDEALRTRFGTPSDPAVFTSLPVEFSSRRAAVAEVIDDAEAETTTFVLAPVAGTEALPPIAVGDVLHWNGEMGKPHQAEVTAVDGDSVTIPPIPFENYPAAFPPAFDETTGEPLPATIVVGDADLLEAGRDLYTVHCMHCHGAAGGGDGPTAKYLHPLPRDYRLGIYKFTSTGSGVPSREDLTRVLREGIPGTYMPSFHPALNESQTAAVVEYVRWLSMQGQYAGALANEADVFYGTEAIRERLESEEGLTREDLVKELTDAWDYNVSDQLTFITAPVAEPWALVETEPPVTPTEPRPELTGEELAASVERGRGLYLQKSTQCASCHGTRGLGNGPQTVSVLIDAATGEPYAEPGIHDVWGEVVMPRNLTRGIYRGGRRPIDLYRRIHSGIVGSNMPGFGDNLSDAEIWDLVNFLLALPLDPSLLEGVEPEPESTAEEPAVAAVPVGGPSIDLPSPVAPQKKADRS